jgi:hypothetical protein
MAMMRSWLAIYEEYSGRKSVLRREHVGLGKIGPETISENDKKS